MAALEPWLKNVDANRRGEELGREIGAMYREIYSAVAEMVSAGEEDEDDEFDDEDEEEGD
ncbi:MAG TPA: hypothetical protein VFN49_01605 [Candidatus Aquilonibacter sp.]|nr:hypothetical protein [Candidatus Aquilonibacter sp.]